MITSIGDINELFSSIKPQEFKDESFADKEEEQKYYHPAHEIYWIGLTIFYIVFSDASNLWEISWVIWILSPIGAILINMYLDKCNRDLY